MKFDPKEYEPVKSRKARFYKDYPEGRIVVESVSVDPNEYAMFKVSVYLNPQEQKDGCPKATGYAHEIRDKEMKTNQYGKAYESVNYSSWNENCEESAVGRALDNAGYSGNLKCSLEEMEQAQKKNNSYNKTEQPTKTDDTLYVTEAQFGQLMQLDSSKALTDGINGYKEQGAQFRSAHTSALNARWKILKQGE